MCWYKIKHRPKRWYHTLLSDCTCTTSDILGIKGTSLYTLKFSWRSFVQALGAGGSLGGGGGGFRLANVGDFGPKRFVMFLFCTVQVLYIHVSQSRSSLGGSLPPNSSSPLALAPFLRALRWCSASVAHATAVATSPPPPLPKLTLSPEAPAPPVVETTPLPLPPPPPPPLCP